MSTSYEMMEEVENRRYIYYLNVSVGKITSWKMNHFSQFNGSLKKKKAKKLLKLILSSFSSIQQISSVSKDWILWSLLQQT